MDPERAAKERRRRFVVAGMAGAFALLGGIGSTLFSIFGDQPEESPTMSKDRAGARSQLRLVSLSPGITETLAYLGVADQILGISDFCSTPEGSLRSDSRSAPPARVGSALTPNYESIARLRPTLIVASHVSGEQLAPLKRIAPTEALPWLTLQDLVESAQHLGELVGQPAEGRELATLFERTLRATPGSDAPEVLLAFESGSEITNETWFIKRNSVHGAVLRAAGGKNAVARDVAGQPKLSPEELLQLDPWAIIVLRPRVPNTAAESRIRKHYEQLKPLSAVRTGRLEVLSIEHALSIGPSLLALVPQLRTVLQRIQQRTNEQTQETGPGQRDHSDDGSN